MSAHDEGRVLHGVRRTVALAKGWLLRGVRVWQVMSGAAGTRRGAPRWRAPREGYPFRVAGGVLGLIVGHLYPAALLLKR
ncbi:MAG TPA: hypothetical protein VKV41_12485 [Methylomirabilota bacterium]|nr:hypothetical protein [Methylomirabilota bacterium]